MTQDVRSASALAPPDTPRRSDLADVRLVSPLDDQIQEVSSLDSSFALTFQVPGDVDLSSYSLRVRDDLMTLINACDLDSCCVCFVLFSVSNG